jgi:hypothetical protein
MYEMLAILISVVFKYITFWRNKKNKTHFEKLLADLKPYQPPQNEEINNLKARKK